MDQIANEPRIGCRIPLRSAVITSGPCSATSRSTIEMMLSPAGRARRAGCSSGFVASAFRRISSRSTASQHMSRDDVPADRFECALSSSYSTKGFADMFGPSGIVLAD